MTECYDDQRAILNGRVRIGLSSNTCLMVKLHKPIERLLLESLKRNL